MRWDVHRWLREHSLKLLAIRDTPDAIAGGVAIGIFFGFVPLFGLKTLSAIFFAWVTRSNILAAVLAGTAHDVILPFMPVIYRWEYNVGFWLLSHPHHWPASIRKVRFHLDEFKHFMTFVKLARPLLLGSLVVAAPPSVLSFFLTRSILNRHRARKAAEQAQDANLNPP